MLYDGIFGLKNTMKKEIEILELFSGIGGFSKGFQDAGYILKKHKFSEIDKHAIANYKYNFKDAESIGSVTDVRGLSRPDIITFGSPCQDFSLAGKRAGMDGQRSSLIREAIRLIDELRPSVFIWENVKGTFSSNNGEDFWAIIAAFANLGSYRLEWQLLNTSWFLPQNRERIYLIGHLAGRSEPGVFPIKENGRLFDKQKGRDESEAKLFSTIATNTFRKESNYVVAPKIAGCLTGGGHSGGLHSDMTTIKVSSNTKKGFDILTENDTINFSNLNSKTRRGRVGIGVAQTLDTQCNQGVIVKPVLTPNRLEKRQNGRRFKEDGEDAFTVTSQDQHGIMIDDNIRRLTEIECERLQGFPDDWTKFGIYEKQVWINKKEWTANKGIEKTFKIIEGVQEIPKTQRYKMIGNAVTVAVVKAIADRLRIAVI